ncbi:F-box/LRR-repeat protein 25 [Citrus sinensis]|uniref:F-box/LRR-repeat protein 25 n=1 Tax=Citrus sinensis TaxID=2711 RepID=A0ACB8I580_CITSI|nr:F-box/LRR-repeat protein 25 [Citrus sinensis]
MDRESGDDNIIMESLSHIDRISNLPEPILHHILSFLPFTQTVQTRVLSRTWKRAWHTFSVLKFDSDFFYQVFPEDSNDVSEAGKQKLREIFNYIKETLRIRHNEMIRLMNFSLFVPGDSLEICLPYIDQCIFYALGCNVKELSLELLGNPRFNLPEIILCSNSIEILTLAGLKLESPRSVKLSSLTKLFLMRVDATDLVLQSLLIGCPLIEYLSLQLCPGLKNLELSGLTKLNKFEVCDAEELQRLCIIAQDVQEVSIQGPLPFQCKFNLASCKFLKYLRFALTHIKDEWLCNQISKFPLLESLLIAGCDDLKSINISSRSLKLLEIYDCLRLVECFQGGDFAKPGRGVSFLLIYFVKNVIVPEDLRRIQPSPLGNVDHLDCTVEAFKWRFAIKSAVDGFLWISPHSRTLSIRLGYPPMSSLKLQFSYRRQAVYEGRIAQCCKSRPISCWWQCIEEVVIEYTYTGKAGNYAERHIFKGEDIWDKMDCLIDLQTQEILDWDF